MIDKDKYRLTLKVNDLVAQILALKQIPLDVAYNILYDQDKILNIDEKEPIVNIDKAAKFLVQCFKEGRDIYVYADYDVDGMTSGTIMKKFLSKIVPTHSEVYFPERSDGYGLSVKFIEDINKKYERRIKPLIMTVDNGITKVEEVELCKKYNIPVLITDHHLPQEILPDTIVVDQHITESDHWAKAICGAGVAYYFCRAIENELGYNHYESDKLLYLTAIGTIADVMPLSSYVNQAIVRKGFNQIQKKQIPNTLRIFLDMLTKEAITADLVSWQIAPRLNACSRLFDIDASIKLFDVSEEPIETCNTVEEYNTRRKELTKDFSERIIKQYDKQNDDSEIALVVNDEIPVGIIGILAGRLQEYSGKPSFVGLSDSEVVHGSARSNTYPLDWLLFNEPSVASYGGHAAACGFAIYKDMQDEFKLALSAKIASYVPPEEVAIEPKEPEYIDLTLSDLTLESYKSFNLFSFDGLTFAKPQVRISGLSVLDVKPSGNNPDNICYTVFDGKTKLSIWAWRLGDLGIKVGDRITMCGDIEKNFMKPRLYTLNVKSILKEE